MHIFLLYEATLHIMLQIATFIPNVSVVEPLIQEIQEEMYLRIPVRYISLCNVNALNRMLPLSLF